MRGGEGRGGAGGRGQGGEGARPGGGAGRGRRAGSGRGGGEAGEQGGSGGRGGVRCAHGAGLPGRACGLMLRGHKVQTERHSCAAGRGVCRLRALAACGMGSHALQGLPSGLARRALRLLEDPRQLPTPLPCCFQRSREPSTSMLSRQRGVLEELGPRGCSHPGPRFAPAERCQRRLPGSAQSLTGIHGKSSGPPGSRMARCALVQSISLCNSSCLQENKKEPHQ